jgi:glyoxylase-like metal-dependent hydrolase (beta-lactamase superfamily II)
MGGPRLIDVRHQGRDRVIGAWLVDGFLLDPGPESCVETLLAGLGHDRPRALLLTHIHFDHAGAAGRLVERWPDIAVYVHERGAPHLTNPERLVASATRIWGDDFARLWGEVVPVPESNLRVLTGGERVGAFEVEYVPGHAKHHVAYFHKPTHHAYVGDMAGVRIPPSSVVRAPTPPPDIDVDAWFDSIHRIQQWRPTALVLTHFGRVDDVDGHLKLVRRALRFQVELARELGLDAFVAAMEQDAGGEIDEETAQRLFDAGDPADSYAGLTRYLQLAPTG